MKTSSLSPGAVSPVIILWFIRKLKPVEIRKNYRFFAGFLLKKPCGFF
jgi:hypothetical protein